MHIACDVGGNRYVGLVLIPVRTLKERSIEMPRKAYVVEAPEQDVESRLDRIRDEFMSWPPLMKFITMMIPVLAIVDLVLLPKAIAKLTQMFGG